MSCLYPGHWKIPLAGTEAAHGHQVPQRAEPSLSPLLPWLCNSDFPSFLLKLPILLVFANSFGEVHSSSWEGQAQMFGAHKKTTSVWQTR